MISREANVLTYIAVQVGASPMTEADICIVMDNCRYIQRQLYEVHQILRAMPLLEGMKYEEFQSSESDPHFLGNETSSCDLDRLDSFKLRAARHQRQYVWPGPLDQT